VRRVLLAGIFVLGLVTAGAFSGAVIADVTTSTTSTTTTGTTSTAATTTTTTTATTTTTTTTTPPLPATIPPGVRVAGVKVGGLTAAEAVTAVQAAFARPLAVVVDRSRLVLDPRAYASAYVTTAVAKARIAEPRSNLKLVVAVHGGPVRAWVAAVAKRFARKPVDAELAFRNDRPVITKDRVGRMLAVKRLTQRLVAALASNSRLPLRVHTKAVAPTVSADAFGEVIVINRSINRLFLYDGEKLRRMFAVATGQAVYPTPRGTFHIVVKWKNPWWYPPTGSAWAKGLQPVPPGPNNPLGTRWMGLSAPGVGIHGTDAPSSIGYSVSHGCIRMQVPDAEWLFDHVDVGTTVHIV
jgi:lipoprotein-anchoring transpeptidase ErfK/SrfK